MKTFCTWLLCAALVAASALAPAAELATAEHGMVVTVSPPASDVGRDVLKRGGTAVDAAVAVALALAVTWPEAGNIGGGGFMMVWPADGKPVCIDYREQAPAAARPDMFKLNESSHTHKMVGVPGTLRGLALAHEKYGRLQWRELVEPAVRLAREGFPVDAQLVSSLNNVLQDSADFAELRRVYGPPEGKPKWAVGDKLVQPELAATLELIAAEGPKAFYDGKIAAQLVAEMQQGNGLITRDDLAAYQARLRQPIHGTYRGYDIYGPPPPSSGGICLVEMLNILEQFKLKAQPAEDAQPPVRTAESMHLMIEAMRRAYFDRARYLGDADFVKIPPHLTTKDYAKKLAGQIDPAAATSSEALNQRIPLAPESESTTHFSIVDEAGLAVSNTYTLEHSFGSRVVVRGAGFLLNNEMGDFNRVPGHTDQNGNIGTKPNLAAPGKRMLSSQCPTLVAKDGKLWLVTGSPGGRTIINTVLCNVTNLVDFGLDLKQATEAPRLHHQWLPDQARFEGMRDPRYAAQLEQLRAWGHRFQNGKYQQGDSHSILIDREAGRLQGVADTRRGGKAAGY